jgi:hypothetical protein
MANVNPTNKIMHGARAKVTIHGTTVGIFTNVSYGMQYDIQPAFILGRFSPAELAYTAAEPISLSCSGWRVIDNGPFSAAGGTMPKLQDLLTAEDMTFSIEDRQTEKNIMTVTGVRHQGFQTSITPRALEEMTLNFMGLILTDETNTDQNEAGQALP